MKTIPDFLIMRPIRELGSGAYTRLGFSPTRYPWISTTWGWIGSRRFSSEALVRRCATRLAPTPPALLPLTGLHGILTTKVFGNLARSHPTIFGLGPLPPRPATDFQR